MKTNPPKKRNPLVKMKKLKSRKKRTHPSLRRLKRQPGIGVWSMTTSHCGLARWAISPRMNTMNSTRVIATIKKTPWPRATLSPKVRLPSNLCSSCQRLPPRTVLTITERRLTTSRCMFVVFSLLTTLKKWCQNTLTSSEDWFVFFILL